MAFTLTNVDPPWEYDDWKDPLWSACEGRGQVLLGVDDPRGLAAKGMGMSKLGKKLIAAAREGIEMARDDKGACYIEMTDDKNVIVTVRSPFDMDESKVSIPLEMWRKMIAHTVAGR